MKQGIIELKNYEWNALVYRVTELEEANAKLLKRLETVERVAHRPVDVRGVVLKAMDGRGSE